MKIRINRRKDGPWFAWYPVLAYEKQGTATNRSIVWLRRCYKCWHNPTCFGDTMGWNYYADKEAAESFDAIKSNDLLSDLGILVAEWEEDGKFLDNAHDHPTDRQVGKTYKSCASSLRHIINNPN